MEHRLWREHQQLNSDTYARNETFLKEVQEKRKRRNFFLRRNKNGRKKKKKNEKHEIEVTLKWGTPNFLLSTEAEKSNFHKRKLFFFTTGTSRPFFLLVLISA